MWTVEVERHLLFHSLDAIYTPTGLSSKSSSKPKHPRLLQKTGSTRNSMPLNFIKKKQKNREKDYDNLKVGILRESGGSSRTGSHDNLNHGLHSLTWDVFMKRKRGGKASSQSSFDSLQKKKVEKQSSSSSNASSDQQQSRRILPDLRMFKLAKNLKRLHQLEEDRLVLENFRWKARPGPVGPSGDEHSTPVLPIDVNIMTTVSEESTSPKEPRLTPKSPFKSISGFFSMKKGKKDRGSDSSSPMNPFVDQSESRRSSLATTIRRDSLSVPLISAHPAERETRYDHFKLTLEEMDNNQPLHLPKRTDTLAIDEIFQQRMSMSSFRRDNHNGGSGGSESGEAMQLIADKPKKRRKSKWLSSQSGDIPDTGGDTPPGGGSRSKRPPFLHFNAYEQGGSVAFNRQRMMGGEPVTPGISEGSNHFTPRRAVRMDYARSAPLWASVTTPLIPPSLLPGTHTFPSVSNPSPNSRSPPSTSPEFATRLKNKAGGYFGESFSMSGSDDVVQFTGERPLWVYQVRQDAEMEQAAPFDHKAEILAAVRDVPDHLPNSPLCPRNWPRHKAGHGICPMHGRAGKERAGELAL